MIASFQPSAPQRRQLACRGRRVRRCGSNIWTAAVTTDDRAGTGCRRWFRRRASHRTADCRGCRPSTGHVSDSQINDAVFGDRPGNPERAADGVGRSIVAGSGGRSSAGRCAANVRCDAWRWGEWFRCSGSAGRSGRRSAGINAAVAARRLCVAATQAACCILVRRRGVAAPNPHAVPTGIVRTGANADAPRSFGQGRRARASTKRSFRRTRRR